MEQPRRSANVRYFSTRGKRGKRKSTPLQIVGLRLVDLATLFRTRYGGQILPNDDSGRDDIKLAVDHLGALAHPARAITRWIGLWAPWLSIGEQQQYLVQGISHRRNWTADQLAWRLRLTKEERKMLGITTIGAIDMPKAARKKRRRDRERMRKANQRRAQGVKPRDEYEGQSLERTQPWKAEGISRATWYRRKRETATTPVTA